tara:strand:- start:896 stop:1735 length:840 start_codon:yes stop_codon:yes gene_type:complete
MNTKNLTAIIPVRIDSTDRFQNINTTIEFLLKYYNCNIILKEVDSTQKIQLPNNSRLTYIFEKIQDTSFFHRTKILNEMLSLVKTKYVVNYDCDMLIPQSTMKRCIHMLNSGYDLVYPYPRDSIYLTFPLDGPQRLKLLNDPNNTYMDYLIKKYTLKWKYNLNFFEFTKLNGVVCSGGMQFFKTKSYIEGYGENESFIDWGPEDYERLYRFYLLGYKIGWTNFENIVHMDHTISLANNNNNMYNIKNQENWKNIISNIKTKEDMIKYMSSLNYIKNVQI